MDAETGEALKDTAGKEITATAKFTPKASSGKQKVKFKFDATLLGGHKAVVFERLYLDGKVQATHEDPGDEDQTVEFRPSRSARPRPIRPTATRQSASARP